MKTYWVISKVGAKEPYIGKNAIGFCLFPKKQTGEYYCKPDEYLFKVRIVSVRRSYARNMLRLQKT